VKSPDLTPLDRTILNRIQSDFPITARPYHTLAKQLDIDETDLIQRLQHLKSIGVIRRIGGNFVPEKMGYVSTLCAAEVPEDKIDAFAAFVNQYPGVTHNYTRDNRFNVWFTFIAPSMKTIERNLADIAEQTGVTHILNLPATHVFKIKAHFNL